MSEIEQNGHVQAKKPVWKKWWFWVIIVVIASGAIGASGESEEVSSSTEQKTESSNNKEETTKEDSEKKGEEEVALGSEGQSGDLALTVNQVTETSEIRENEFNIYTPESGAKYAIINVTVKNNGKEALWLSSNYIKLITTDGAAYEPTSILSVEGAFLSTLDELNPGIATTGNIAFEVPTGLDVTSATLAFSSSSVFKNPVSCLLK